MGRFPLAVTSTNREKILTRVARTGSNETGFTSGDVLFPACSPDGQFAYYLNGVHPEKTREISVVDGSLSEIADVLGDTLFGNIVISPDGAVPSPVPSLADRFGPRRGQVLFYLGCYTLRSFAIGTARKLAPVICADVGVVLSPRSGYVREAIVDQELAFLGVHVD